MADTSFLKRVSQATTYTIDPVLKHGVLADGSTDNATALMAMNTALAGTDNFYQIQFGAGEVRYTPNAPWLYGIKRYAVIGAGPELTKFKTIYTGSDWSFQRPFYVGNLFQDSVLSYAGSLSIPSSYLFNTVTVGSLTVTTTTAGDAANFAAGNRILLWGRDQVGNGYPPGVRYFEWNEVVSVNAGTGVITLRYPIKQSYNSLWHDIADLLASGKNVGKPRILNIDRTNGKYAYYAEFRNLRFCNDTHGDPGYGLVIADTLVVTNCIFESYLYPSECRVATYTDCTILGDTELDKLVGDLTFIRCKFVGKVTNGGGVQNCKFIDCTFTQSTSPDCRYYELRGCNLRADTLPDVFQATLAIPPAQISSRRVTLEKLTFFATGNYTNVAHVDIAPFMSYTITNITGSSILIPWIAWTESDSSFKPVRKMEEGVTRMFKDDGSKCGLITSITFDPTYNSGQGAWTIAGNWGPDVTKTGTITATTSSTAVVGVSTLFTTELSIGQSIYSGSTVLGRITAIASNTSLTLAANSAANATAAAYKQSNAPVVGEVWKWSPVNEVIDLGGHITNGLPLFRDSSARWSGNTESGRFHTTKLTSRDMYWSLTAGLVIDYNARILDITVTINKAYNGTGTDANLVIENTAPTFSEFIKVNMKMLGTRHVSEFVAEGLKTGDRVSNANATIAQGFQKQVAIYCRNASTGVISDISDPALPEMEILIRWCQI